MTNRYDFGKLIPWWDDSFKTLDYEYYPLTNTHDLERWLSEGYSGLNLNGELYSMKKPMPDYAQPFFKLFDWENVGISFYRMNTLDALPLHQDSYISYRKMFDITDPGVIWRGIVFLEDWKSGHYFEIDGKAHLNWQAGDYVFWNYDVPHYAANFGLEPRYTMQITGMKQ
jgi:hypothetical protein